MKATDFNLAKELNFDFEHGITSFRDTRLVLLDANALGLLRQNLIDTLGLERARSFFLRFGYQHGFADFMQFKEGYVFESELELLGAGPVIHTWEGIVKAHFLEIRYNLAEKNFYATGRWENSYEVEQHLSYNEPATDPVCWSLMGYASGWCSNFCGTKIIAIETKCIGKGDAECHVVLKPTECWDEVAKPYIEAYKKF